jgi:hypothetical protein
MGSLLACADRSVRSQRRRSLARIQLVAPMAQQVEAGGLNPPQYGFESHWGHFDYSWSASKDW